MTVHIGNNVTIEVGTAYAAADTVSALTKANPGVATSTAHGIADGTYFYINVTDGMRRLHTQAARAANGDANSFELEGVDTTNYQDWASGTAVEVTTWSTLCLATTYAINNAPPDEVDETTLCDDIRRFRFGLPGQKSGTISIQHDSDSTVLQYLEDRDPSDIVAFRITYPNGNIRTFGAYTAYGGGFAGGVSELETGEIPIAVPAKVITYAS